MGTSSGVNIKSLPSSDKCIFVKEDNYASDILSKLDTLRRNISFCDIVLQVDDIEFPAHKIVLTSFSSYFEIMFQESKYVESQQNVIHLKDIAVESMRLLLNYAYSGSLTITKSNCVSLLSAVDILQVISLAIPVRNAACTFLENEIDVSNCLGISYFAECYDCKNLHEKAANFVLKNFWEISQNAEFLDITAEQLIEFTSSDNLEVEKEELVFLAIRRWVDKRPENRTAYFEKVISLLLLLETVKLPLIHPDFLQNSIQSFPAVNLNPKCLKMVEEAMCYSPNNRCIPRHEILVYFGVSFPVTLTDEFDRAECACYCPTTNNWRTLPSLPFAIIEKISLVACNEKNYVYLAGGEFSNGTTSKRFWRYTPFINRWQEMISMLIPRKLAGLAVMDGYIYALGGCNEHSSILDSVERYDPKTSTWTFVHKLKMPISRATVIAYDKMLYVAGGWEKGLTNRVQRYHPETDTWTELPPMLNARCDAVSCVLDGFIYIIGGCKLKENSARVTTHLSERFDVKNNRWESIKSVYGFMSYLAGAVINKKICVIGNTLSCTTMQMHCYNPKLNTWDTISRTASRSHCFQKMVPIKIPRRIVNGFTSEVDLASDG